MTGKKYGAGEAWSFLAPAAIGLLPALLLGFFPAAKGEVYDWTQHLVAGLAFGAVFFLTFLFGGWRRHGAAAAAGAGALAVIAAVIWRQGLPGFPVILAAAGLVVGAGYWFTQRREPRVLGEAVLVAVASALGLWALSQLSWWVPFSQTVATLGNRLWVLGITAVMVGCLGASQEVRARTRIVWGVRLLDAAVLALLAAAVVRTTDLADNIMAAHHWSVFVAPAEMVREGRALLGQVPSQYGFLDVLVLAWLPTRSCLEALYCLQVVTLWLSGAILYFVLRTRLAAWWGQIVAGLVAILCVACFCGDLSQLSGPMVYPNVGAVRFIWVHLLVGYLFWWQHTASPQASTRRVLWIGSVLWLFGVLWSVESALYVTAAWLPAASLLAMPPEDEMPAGCGGRLRALGLGIGRALRVVGVCLAGAVALIEICYLLSYGQAPRWASYLEYARAFTGGFFALPIEPRGPVWALLLLHTGLLAALVSVSRRRHLALVWAAWGACWSVSTYYVSRSHPNNISNLGPVLLLVVGLLIYVAQHSDRRSLVRPWAWIVGSAWMGAVLWLVATNSVAAKRQLTEYRVEPRVDRLLPVQAGAEQLLADCQRTQPGPFSLIGANGFSCVTFELTVPHPNWLPLRSVPLYGPLPLERREHYLDAYHGRALPGWLLAPLNLRRDEFSWLFDYIDARYVEGIHFYNDSWQAWYYEPRAEREPPPAP
jgi:hypothetical protein